MMRRGVLACAVVVCLVTGTALTTAACALRPTGITDGAGRVARVSPGGPYVFFYVNGVLRPLPRNRDSAAPDEHSSVGPPVPTVGVNDDPRSRAVWSV